MTDPGLIEEIDRRIAALEADLAHWQKVRVALTTLAAASEPEPKPKPRPRRTPATKRAEVPLPPLPPEPDPVAPAPDPEPPAPDPAPLPDPSGSARLADLVVARVPDVDVTEAEARDVLAKEKGEFRSNVLMVAFGVSRRQADELVALWVERGMLRHTRGRGATARYEYVKPTAVPGPTSRPRHDSPRALPKGAATVARGTAVPHTGRAMGPSGKPGQDKKNSAKGHRVKRARQGT